MKKAALGKGLAALIPQEKREKGQEKYRSVKLTSLVPNRFQPRSRFEEKKLGQLADSISKKGVLQPILVRQVNGSFEIVAGERRFRAAEKVGLTEVPVLVLDDVDDRDMLELSIIENLQREDLNPLELAEGYQRLMTEFSMTQVELSTRIGKDRSSIANTLRLLQLPGSIKEMISAGDLTEGHARAILALDSDQKRLQLARRILAEDLTVRTIEEIIYGPKRRKRGRSLKLKSRPLEVVSAETALKRKLGTNVVIQRGLKKGKIVIQFYGDQDLTRILEVLEVTI
ncbi:MAG: ParB/RepB/Spo0J family partition protein [candidate division Zixibacteria bacterium]|nr:ParB/RepB/Spo0J family partition protein [candidate division Zixibacteria bacterium]